MRHTASDRQTVTKPPDCPRCGAERTIPIMYGYPMYTAFEAQQRGELVLAGCVTGHDAPRWACPACGQRFHQRTEPEPEQ